MEITRNFDILDQLVEKYNIDKALSVKRHGRWEFFSTDQYKQFVDLFSYGLLEMGFKKGDKILTMSNNRPEWNFVDMAMGQIGVVHVPVYTNLSDDEHLFVIEHSDARIIIVSSATFYIKMRALADKVEAIEDVYMFDEVSGGKNWMEIVELGRASKEKWEKKLPEIKASIDKDDLLSIIYTSGTTGRPKGVMLSHYNFMSNVLYSGKRYPLNFGQKYMSILPMCHVFERMVNYMVQNDGVSICYAESIDHFVRDIQECKADGFAAVPRLYEKIFDRIMVVGKNLKSVKKVIFNWAVNLGLRYELDGANGWFYELKLKIANKLVFKKWREVLGGKATALISGGAALQPRLSRIFNAAGIMIAPGYGLTETSPVISVNYPGKGNMKFGTTGPVLENVEVKIADDGEILMKGPSLMKGYYKNPEKTKEAIDEQGWFHTGDIGELEEGRFLKITDRKKEMFKLSTGKYVAPQVLENIFKESPFIEQLFVVGYKEKFVAGIICPNFEYLNGWAFTNGIIYRDAHDLIKNPKVIARFQKEVDTLNKRLSHHEQVKKFELTCRNWTVETGELSPTLKLKRRYLRELYKVKLDHIYGYTDQNGDLGLRIDKMKQSEN